MHTGATKNLPEHEQYLLNALIAEATACKHLANGKYEAATVHWELSEELFSRAVDLQNRV